MKIIWWDDDAIQREMHTADIFYIISYAAPHFDTHYCES